MKPTRELRCTPCLRGREAESGAASLEFLLAIPALLLFITVVLQYLFFLHMRAVVNYSAYAAARSAVVWMQRPGQRPALGSWLDGRGTEGSIRVHHAAALACMPVSIPAPRSSTLGLMSFRAGTTMLRTRFAQVDAIRSNLERLAYASSATRVKIEIQTIGRGKDSMKIVSATVRFTAPYFVPLAGPILGRDRAPMVMRLGGRDWNGYHDIHARYLLPLGPKE